MKLLLVAGLALTPLFSPQIVAKPNVSIGIDLGFRLPHGSINVNVGKRHYRYHDGSYYHKSNRGYTVVRAPRGAVIPRLPRGHARVHFAGTTYFRFENTYYSRVPQGYIVVDTPTVDYVHKGETEVVEYSATPEISFWLEGKEFILADGQFFQRSPDGLVWVESPYGAVTKRVPQSTRRVWYKRIEHFEYQKVYLRKTSEGFEVIPAPWTDDEK